MFCASPLSAVSGHVVLTLVPSSCSILRLPSSPMELFGSLPTIPLGILEWWLTNSGWTWRSVFKQLMYHFSAALFRAARPSLSCTFGLALFSRNKQTNCVGMMALSDKLQSSVSAFDLRVLVHCLLDQKTHNHHTTSWNSILWSADSIIPLRVRIESNSEPAQTISVSRVGRNKDISPVARHGELQ